MKTAWWVLCWLFAFNSNAQPFGVLGGDKQDQPFDLIVTDEEVIVVGGGLTLQFPNISDGFVLKTTKDLDLLSFTYYIDTMEREGYYSLHSRGDTLYVGGRKTNYCCDSLNHWAAALFLVVNGELDTTILYGPFGAEMFTDVIERNGFLYFFGNSYYNTTEAPGPDANDPYVVKCDVNGQMLWMEHPGTVYFDNVFKATLDATGENFICAGGSATQVGSDPYYDGYIIKLDTTANVIWRKTYKSGIQRSDYFNSITATADGGGIVVGYTDDSALGAEAPYIVRFDANGDTLWTRVLYRFSESANSTYNKRWRESEIHDVIQLNSGDFVFAGDWYNADSSSRDVFICKFSEDGDSLWRIDLGDAWEDNGYCIASDENDFIYVAGSYSNPFTANGSKDVLLIKLDANGCTVDTCLMSSLVQAQTVSTNPFSLYPNPADGSIRIELTNPLTQQGTQFIVRDLNSRIVLHQAISNNTTFSVESLSAGVYIAELVQRSGERFYQRFIKQ